LSTSKSKKRQKLKPWWRSSRNRNKIWGVLFSVLAVAALGGFAWLALSSGGRGTTGGEQPIPVGEQVQPFTLPNIVSDRDFSLDDNLGKREIVVVGYMGFF